MTGHLTRSAAKQPPLGMAPWAYETPLYYLGRPHDGARVALEGDEVSCHTCGGTGTIRCTGPRTPERFDGRLLALENDVCICNCVTPPTLLPSQHLRYQAFEDGA
jgi:hypothetical protein